MLRATVSEKDIQRMMVVGRVYRKELKQKDGAKQLGLSPRQIKRLVSRFRTHGTLSLGHQGRGKPSKRKRSQEMVERIVGLLKGKYQGFPPTLASEKLIELEGISISNESLRQLMIREGLWRSKAARSPRVYPPRARRPCYGELIQVDGSHHAWLEDRAPKCVALVFVDDATSRLQAVHFCPTEDLMGYLYALKSYVQTYGCPEEIYTDKHSVFTINNRKDGKQKGITQFGRILEKLNIKQHLANTPQAKGRVERMNRVLQDRLIKEMRMANIHTINQANAFVAPFIERYNAKFAKPALGTRDAHTPLSEEHINHMDTLFAIKEKRKVSKALTVQYQNAIYAINQVRTIRTLRRRGVTVYEKLDGEVKMLFDGKELNIQLLEHVKHEHKSLSRKELDIQLDSSKYFHQKNSNTENYIR